MRLTTLIKKKLKYYKPLYEYYINLSDITITPSYSNTFIRPSKWKFKMSYYKKHGEFESSIILNENFELIDGYSSYKIAKYLDIAKVPVYFTKEGGE